MKHKLNLVQWRVLFGTTHCVEHRGEVLGDQSASIRIGANVRNRYQVNLLKFAQEKLMKSYQVNLLCGRFQLFGTTLWRHRVVDKHQETKLRNGYQVNLLYTYLEKFIKLHQVNLFLAGFSYLEPQCSAGEASESPQCRRRRPKCVERS